MITHCKRGHEFTPENTIIIKDYGFRHCRICYNMLIRRKRLKIRIAELQQELSNIEQLLGPIRSHKRADNILNMQGRVQEENSVEYTKSS